MKIQTHNDDFFCYSDLSFLIFSSLSMDSIVAPDQYTSTPSKELMTDVGTLLNSVEMDETANFT